MQVLYLGCSPEVKVLLVEVFIVPVFSLMGNVHRENMQTQKIIDSQEKWAAAKHPTNYLKSDRMPNSSQSTCPPTSPPLGQHVCQSAHLSIHLSVLLPVHLPKCPSTCLSFCQWFLSSHHLIRTSLLSDSNSRMRTHLFFVVFKVLTWTPVLIPLTLTVTSVLHFHYTIYPIGVMWLCNYLQKSSIDSWNDPCCCHYGNPYCSVSKTGESLTYDSRCFLLLLLPSSYQVGKEQHFLCK